MSPLLALATFAIAFMTDLIWVRCVHAVQRGARLPAVLWTVTLGALSTVGLLVVVHDVIYLLPDLLGLGAGTYVAMSFGRKETT